MIHANANDGVVDNFLVMRYTFDMKRLFSWITCIKSAASQPVTRYEEICAIKDRLYRDIARLEQLQGNLTAGRNVKTICEEILGANFGK